MVNIDTFSAKVDQLSITVALLAIKIKHVNNKIDYVLNRIDRCFIDITNPKTTISQSLVSTSSITNLVGIDHDTYI